MIHLSAVCVNGGGGVVSASGEHVNGRVVRASGDHVNGRVVTASGELSGVLYQDCCHSCCLKSYLLNSD